MTHETFFIYLALMAGSTFLIRAIPFVLVKKKIENIYIRSFLTYIPYAVLTAMTPRSSSQEHTHIAQGSSHSSMAITEAHTDQRLSLHALQRCTRAWARSYLTATRSHSME